MQANVKSYDCDTSVRGAEKIIRDGMLQNQENAFKLSPKSQMIYNKELLSLKKDAGSQLTYKSGKIFFGLANSNR